MALETLAEAAATSEARGKGEVVHDVGAMSRKGNEHRRSNIRCASSLRYLLMSQPSSLRFSLLLTCAVTQTTSATHSSGSGLNAGNATATKLLLYPNR